MQTVVWGQTQCIWMQLLSLLIFRCDRQWFFYLSYLPCLFQALRPSFVATEGDVVTLRVRVMGNPEPDVYWRKGPVDDIDTSKGRFRIVEGGSLQVWRMHHTIAISSYVYWMIVLYGFNPIYLGRVRLAGLNCMQIYWRLLFNFLYTF